MRLRHITRGGLHQFRAPEFAARITRHNGIASPIGRAEERAAGILPADFCRRDASSTFSPSLIRPYI